MRFKVKISIVVPTYNESQNLPVLIDQLVNVFEEYKIDANIIIVDDNSPDGTGIVAEELSNKNTIIHVIHRDGKLGIGSAYISGIEYAIEKIASDVVFTMDSDLSHDPKCIPDFIELCIKGCDVVVGSRYIENGGIENWSFSRKIISKGANFSASMLLGVKVHDMTSGYRCYTKKVIQTIDLKSIKSDGYSFLEEILFICKQNSFIICETPIVFYDRAYGKSKLSRYEMVKFLITILKLKILR